MGRLFEIVFATSARHPATKENWDRVEFVANCRWTVALPKVFIFLYREWLICRNVAIVAGLGNVKKRGVHAVT